MTTDYRKEDENIRIQNAVITAIISPIGSGILFFFGFFMTAMVFTLIGRAMNICELVRWIFCKSC